MQKTASRYGRELTRGGSAVCLLVERLTTPLLLKNSLLRKCHTGFRNWTDSLKRPKQRKMYMRFGTWNVRSRHR
jgi:hypothetical protein